jgi:hypothetical protein
MRLRQLSTWNLATATVLNVEKLFNLFSEKVAANEQGLAMVGF